MRTGLKYTLKKKKVEQPNLHSRQFFFPNIWYLNICCLHVLILFTCHLLQSCCFKISDDMRRACIVGESLGLSTGENSLKVYLQPSLHTWVLGVKQTEALFHLKIS